ncbi:hypothetical protein L484_020611 [Morus notabilis]|uniref:Uncharacterized protein n=1 Tax=Morus notabilis TaxID=981085 RepID=W9S932_9ROSA|nr:hypothetical protein L484_020611 [Morus notabilis]
MADAALSFAIERLGINVVEAKFLYGVKGQVEDAQAKTTVYDEKVSSCASDPRAGHMACHKHTQCPILVGLRFGLATLMVKSSSPKGAVIFFQHLSYFRLLSLAQPPRPSTPPCPPLPLSSIFAATSPAATFAATAFTISSFDLWNTTTSSTVLLLRPHRVRQIRQEPLLGLHHPDLQKPILAQTRHSPIAHLHLRF